MRAVKIRGILLDQRYKNINQTPVQNVADHPSSYPNIYNAEFSVNCLQQNKVALCKVRKGFASSSTVLR